MLLIAGKDPFLFAAVVFIETIKVYYAQYAFFPSKTIDPSIATSNGTPESSQTTRIIGIARGLAWRAYPFDQSELLVLSLIFPLSTFPFIHRRVSRV